MNKTICIQVGNTDNKLTQQRWSIFVERLKMLLTDDYKATLHFSGGSPTEEMWQNYCVVASLDAFIIHSFYSDLIELRKEYEQDSVAILEGDAQFI